MPLLIFSCQHNSSEQKKKNKCSYINIYVKIYIPGSSEERSVLKAFVVLFHICWGCWRLSLKSRQCWSVEYVSFFTLSVMFQWNISFHRQYMEELVTYVERNPRSKKCSKWKSDGILSSLPTFLREAIRPTAWRECYTKHDIQACLSRVQTVGYNEKRVTYIHLS